MKVSEIPFNTHLGIEETDPSLPAQLMLRYRSEVTNHLGTVHAAAQFALAEATSGQLLLERFAEQSSQHIAVLRKSEIKFRNPASSDLRATASADTDELESFEQRLSQRGRALLGVSVVVKDASDEEVMRGRFDWFVQRDGL
jgi:acyl-coenzyme A thioesterase PaaI-like protein